MYSPTFRRTNLTSAEDAFVLGFDAIDDLMSTHDTFDASEHARPNGVTMDERQATRAERPTPCTVSRVTMSHVRAFDNVDAQSGKVHRKIQILAVESIPSHTMLNLPPMTKAEENKVRRARRKAGEAPKTAGRPATCSCGDCKKCRNRKRMANLRAAAKTASM